MPLDHLHERLSTEARNHWLEILGTHVPSGQTFSMWSALTCDMDLQEMEAEIARFHKTNAALDLTLSEYRLKENGLQKEILRQRHTISDGEQVIK